VLPWITAQPLTDHHCHGVLRDDVSADDLARLLDEGQVTKLTDSLAGLSFLRWCPPVLDLPSGVSTAAYVARRAELGASEVTRRFLGGAWLGALFVDTGFHGDRLLAPAELGELAGATSREVIRLESLAVDVAVKDTTAAGFATAYREALSAASKRRDVIAAKSIAAYRVGLDLSPQRPSDRDIAAAAGRWLSEANGRLADETLHRFFIWSAAELGLPVQFHAGYGDSDLDLHQADPLLLTPLIRALEPTGARIMLLHNYPFHRNAGYLAQVFPHVYADLGLATHNVGRRSQAVLAEALELVPFSKFLYSSDAFGLPELFYLGALHFRRALSALLEDGVNEGDWSEADTERITRSICAENAAHAYRFTIP
jgi:uncharacterized protein